MSAPPPALPRLLRACVQMYKQRRFFVKLQKMVLRIQRFAKLRYCYVRVKRRHTAAAEMILSFLQV